MKLITIVEGIAPQVLMYNEDEDFDGVGERCYQIAKESGINISSNKSLTLVALDGEEPVGAVWTVFALDRDYSESAGTDVYHFDFDIAVSKSARSLGLTTARVGPRLIDAALEHYRGLRDEVDGAAYIRVWAVNPKLARYMEEHYGFESDGRPHLSYHGK